jgi:hypothetical protein
MGTAGDNFLRNMLNTGTDRPVTMSNPTTGGNGQPTPPPDVPRSERSTTATTDIDAATEQARETERKRVEAGMPPWWDIFGDTSATTGGGGAQGPGGYKFDAETIAAKITQWEQVLLDLQKDGVSLQDAAQVVDAPSHDKPAKVQVEATRSSINAAVNHNDEMQQYALAYIRALQKANGTYTQHDQSVSDNLPDTGTLYK